MRWETRQSSGGARGGKARLGCNRPRKRGGNPAGFGLRGCRCLRYVRCGGRRNRAAGEPEGARPASGAINRGNAEATPQASACGVVAVCGMLDAAGDATEQQGSPRGQGPPRVQSTAETRAGHPAGRSLRGCRCLRYVRCGGLPRCADEMLHHSFGKERVSKKPPASYRTCGAVLCNVRFRLRAALTSSAT